MKIKETHRRDFFTYIWFNRQVNKRLGNKYYFCPDNYKFERGNRDTILCFVEKESRGYIGKKKKELDENDPPPPFDPDDHPKEPMLLTLALDGKKLLNWHIKQWAEGLRDGTFIAWELRNYLFTLPDWVGEALFKQWLK